MLPSQASLSPVLRLLSANFPRISWMAVSEIAAFKSKCLLINSSNEAPNVSLSGMFIDVTRSTFLK